MKSKIVTEFNQARKDRADVKKNLLSVVIGEIEKLDKSGTDVVVSDADISKILLRLVKSTKENIDIYSKSASTTTRLEEAKIELQILESYLPKGMSKEEVTDIIKGLISDGKNNIGDVMKHFKDIAVDKKLVQQIFKSL